MRAIYAKSGKVPYSGQVEVEEILSGAVSETIDRATYQALGEGRGIIVIYMKDEQTGVVTMEFSYETGSSTFVWDY
ncbi:hypothetical protein OAU50_05735 [Planctomycetota bacterium]|nr:hypothetical protein [Planctomycetota bacterium]